MRLMTLAALLAAASFFATGCDQKEGADDHGHEHGKDGEHAKDGKGEDSKAMTAHAEIKNPQGDTIGHVSFTEVEGGVNVEASVKGIAPGKHGFHIHEEGDCSAADFSSAKGHWNPKGSKHGAPSDDEHHAGDLGNIEVGDDGEGKLELTARGLTVAKGEMSVVGKAVILHEKADDLKSQPTGDAGGRIGCGVIEKED